MPESLPLLISPAGDDRPLTRDQKRFNTLIRQIEQSRATLRAWQDKLALYRQAYQDVLVPLEAKMKTQLLEWALALDAAMGSGRWARGDRQAAQEMVIAVAAEVLEGDEGNVHARTLFERHVGMEFERAQKESAEMMEEMAEALGLDTDDDEEGPGEPEPEPAPRAEKPGVRKPSAQQRREAEAQRVTQSLREVFRKLASALHPDREPDPAKRAEKTALMARVNEAYGREDLLALLELQLQIEQIDAEHLANVDATRLKHYNKVLAEQAAELREEVQAVEMGFRAEFGVSVFTPLDPWRLGKVLESQAAKQRANLAQLRQEAQGFELPGWAKSWLKVQRRYRKNAWAS